MGFQFLDYFATEKLIRFKESKFDYHFAEGEFSGKSFVLIKPDSYVNNSGLALLDCTAQYKVDNSEMLVVVDDINLKLADIRVRKSGGDGGHNGLSSIIYHLQSNKFPRLRIGIGSDFESGNLVDHVLSNFDKNELMQLEKAFEISKQLTESFISDGYDKMLSSFSRLKNIDKLNKKSE